MTPGIALWVIFWFVGITGDVIPSKLLIQVCSYPSCMRLVWIFFWRTPVVWCNYSAMALEIRLLKWLSCHMEFSLGWTSKWRRILERINYVSLWRDCRKYIIKVLRYIILVTRFAWGDNLHVGRSRGDIYMHGLQGPTVKSASSFILPLSSVSRTWNWLIRREL